MHWVIVKIFWPLAERSTLTLGAAGGGASSCARAANANENANAKAKTSLILVFPRLGRRALLLLLHALEPLVLAIDPGARLDDVGVGGIVLGEPDPRELLISVQIVDRGIELAHQVDAGKLLRVEIQDAEV